MSNRSKDYTGQKFYQLTAIKPTNERNSSGGVIWEMLCDCGETTYLSPGRAESGHIKTCGHNQTRDWTDIKYGLLTFIRPTEERSDGGRIIWEGKCECGAIVRTIPRNGLSGCKDCHPIWTPTEAAAHRAWKGYRDGDIDFDTFYKLSQLPCYYCGAPPSNVCRLPERHGVFIYNGLDRIDSSLLHTIANVVPCCVTCNWMKSNLAEAEFHEHIVRIYEWSEKRREQLLVWRQLEDELEWRGTLIDEPQSAVALPTYSCEDLDAALLYE